MKQKHIKEFNQYIEDESLFEIANVLQSRTGLPSIIWISPKMSNHGPRIKVQGDLSHKLKNDILFTVTISDNPSIIGDTGELSQKDINLIIIEFVKINKEPLLDYWNEVDTDIINIIQRFKKIK